QLAYEAYLDLPDPAHEDEALVLRAIDEAIDAAARRAALDDGDDALRRRLDELCERVAGLTGADSELAAQVRETRAAAVTRRARARKAPAGWRCPPPAA